MPTNNNSTDKGISRRDLLIGAGAAATVLASGASHAESHAAHKMDEHAGHKMGDHAGHRHEDHAPRHPDLVDAVNTCLDKGQRCIAHCLVAFTEGDMSLAACAKKAHEMEAVCEALSYLVTANSDYMKEQAKICSIACKDCEKECREHEDHHTECKECAEACANVIKTIDKTFA